MSLDDAVEELSADEAELAIDGGCCATCKIPSLRLVMRERRISVLEVCDGN